MTELIFDDDKQTKYKELTKFGFEDELWNLISESFNYTGIQDINELSKRFLMTSVFRSKTRRSASLSKNTLLSKATLIAALLMQKISLEELNMIQDIERCKKNMLKN